MSNTQSIDVAGATSPQYPMWAIVLATLFGSPMATAFLLRRNLKKLNETGRAIIPIALLFLVGPLCHYYFIVKVPPDIVSQLTLYAGPLLLLIYGLVRLLRRSLPSFCRAHSGIGLREAIEALLVSIPFQFLALFFAGQIFGLWSVLFAASR